ncbi:hypothetical protein HPB47_027415 [Ixodes persulcatus]|uniref:Uncharacterized protein n=1 Tax=Ixodes persulcatus TaxID=34615 RepID=A0AC60PVY5_IXOPE|nr:hypothetical protein HPB47_027415 [Ixodes persulcatus]
MHPIFNTERREKRAEALIRRFDLMDSKSVAYVDAASGKSGAAVALVVDGRGAPVSAATIRSRNAETAEEAAHELARVLYFRVTVEPPDCRNMDERLQNYTEIVENYRLQRKQVPPPDKSLSNREAVAWRRLQAGNFINPVWAYHVQIDDRQNDKCKHCGARGTLDHIIWECASSPGAKANINCREAWEALLRSEVPAPQ